MNMKESKTGAVAAVKAAPTRGAQPVPSAKALKTLKQSPATVNIPRPIKGAMPVRSMKGGSQLRRVLKDDARSLGRSYGAPEAFAVERQLKAKMHNIAYLMTLLDPSPSHMSRRPDAGSNAGPTDTVHIRAAGVLTSNASGAIQVTGTPYAACPVYVVSGTTDWGIVAGAAGPSARTWATFDVLRTLCAGIRLVGLKITLGLVQAPLEASGLLSGAQLPSNVQLNTAFSQPSVSALSGSRTIAMSELVAGKVFSMVWLPRKLGNWTYNSAAHHDAMTGFDPDDFYPLDPMNSGDEGPNIEDHVPCFVISGRGIKPSTDVFSITVDAVYEYTTYWGTFTDTTTSAQTARVGNDAYDLEEDMGLLAPEFALREPSKPIRAPEVIQAISKPDIMPKMSVPAQELTSLEKHVEEGGIGDTVLKLAEKYGPAALDIGTDLLSGVIPGLADVKGVAKLAMPAIKSFFGW